jgi:hypothetical protein
VLRADGSVDSRTIIHDAYAGATGTSSIRSVATIDGSAFYVSGTAPGVPVGLAGVRMVPYTGGASTSVRISSTALLAANYRVVGFGPNLAGAPQLYVGVRDPTPLRGLSAVGAGVPTSEDAPVTLLPGQELYGYTIQNILPVAFVFESPTSLWMVDTAGFQTNPIQQFIVVQWTYSAASASWASARPPSRAPSAARLFSSSS